MKLVGIELDEGKLLIGHQEAGGIGRRVELAVHLEPCGGVGVGDHVDDDFVRSEGAAPCVTFSTPTLPSPIARCLSTERPQGALIIDDA